MLPTFFTNAVSARRYLNDASAKQASAKKTAETHATAIGAMDPENELQAKVPGVRATDSTHGLQAKRGSLNDLVSVVVVLSVKISRHNSDGCLQVLWLQVNRVEMSPAYWIGQEDSEHCP